MTAKELARYFDHTLLRASATHEDFDAFCADCARYGFAMAAINSAPVRYVHAPASLACVSDLDAVLNLARALIHDVAKEV